MANILLVDDEPEIRAVLSRILENAGHDVEVAANGDEALKKLHGNRADLVITDIIMPGLDGVGLMKAMRKDFPKLPIIAISGGGYVAPAPYSPDSIATNAYLTSANCAGANRTLSKPFDRQAILAAVAELLD